MDYRTRASIVDRYRLSGSAELSGPVDRGFQGEIWQLTDGDHRYALKLTLVPLSDAQARRAYAFQRRAAALGVAAPHQYRTTDGAIMINSTAGGIRLFDWVDMVGPERDLEPALVGELLARLHRCGELVDEDVHPWYVDPVGQPRWRALIDALAVRHGPYAAELAEILPGLLELESWLVPPDPPHLLGHRDLWADNVRGWTGPGLLVIDWDNCGAVDPSQELGMVLTEFGTDRTRAAALYEAYVGSGGPGRLTRVQDFSMTIATLGHILEAGLQGWVAAGTADERERAAGRIQEWVESPLRPAQLGDLLDWVASW